MPVYEPQAQETFDWLKDFAQKNEVEGRLQLIPFQKDTLPYLAAMDIFVLGTYKETYSLAVIDAMLMGLPLIGTNTGGTPEQLGQDRGILVEPQSAQSIADAIVRYVEQPELRARHGENGKVWAQREHSWENKLGKLAGLYAGVLAN
jgi:glycosyltransferase involved in cell wall biosynthesis